MGARKHHKPFKPLLLISIAVALLCLAIGATAAYLVVKSDDVVNEFIPVKVTCEVQETFTNGTKSNVTVKNTGDIKAYLRAYIVASWVSEDGEKTLGTAPVAGTDYTVTMGTGWLPGADGFWYYPGAVEPNASTTELIKTATAAQAPDGYKLHIEILASAIQAEPSSTVQTQWGVSVTNGALNP